MNIKIKLISTTIILTLLLISGLFFNGQASCNFEIDGKVSVLSYISGDIDSSLYGQELPVGKAKIQIEKKKCLACRWRKIAEVKTNTSGNFYHSSIQTGNACTSGLKTRAKIKFESTDIELRRGSFIDEYGLPPKWYMMKELSKDSCKPSGECNYGNMIFRNNNENDLSDFTAIIHADIWYFYNWANEYMDSIGAPIIKNSNEKIRTVYPLNRFMVPDKLEGSYVNPQSKIIHIHEDHYRFDIVMHELAHLWAFNSTTGESVMKNYLLTKFSTHDLVSKPEVAFHEGFADWWMMTLKNRYLHEISMNLKAPEIILKKYFHEQMNLQSHSFTRCEHSFLSKKRRHDQGRLECHEKGWLNIFQLLTLDDFILPGSGFSEEIFTYNLYSSQNPRGQFATKLNNGIDSLGPEDLSCRPYPLSISFLELLETINGMDSSSMNLEDFLNQLQSQLQLDNNDIELFKDIMDPTNEESLASYYCHKSLVVSDISLPGFEPHEWDMIDGKFVKRNPIRVKVKNMASVETVGRSFLETPIANVHESTDDQFNIQKIPLGLNGVNMIPGEEVIIDQIIEVNLRQNGSFPLTILPYKTIVLGSNTRFKNLLPSTNNHLINGWRTNSKNFSFAPDIKTTLEFKNKTFQNILLSSKIDTVDYLGIKNLSIQSFSPSIEVIEGSEKHQNLISKKRIYGECKFRNIGNVSTLIPTKASVMLNGKKIMDEIIPEIKVGITKILPFYLTIKNEDLNRSLSITCEINKSKKKSAIDELRLFNNTDTKTVNEVSLNKNFEMEKIFIGR